MKWIPDLIYVCGVSVIGVGLWWERPSWSMVFVGAALMFPVVLNWVRFRGQGE